ncbi:MAG: adenylosuccinate lyase [Candidatus Micrarchaeia archaeon]
MVRVFSFKAFLSPFSWRYGSMQMRGLFSEEATRIFWRKTWIALAEAQGRAGIVSKTELSDIKKHALNVDIEESHRLEKRIKHDLMAELSVFASQCRKGGGKLHLGATSMDVEDNAEAVRNKQALLLVRKKLVALLKALSAKIKRFKNTSCMAFTHLQPAEPTTLGYRFANYAQDFLLDLEKLDELYSGFKGKGLKGAVGTAASYKAMLKDSRLSAEKLEELFLKKLGLEAFDVTTQTSPRKQDYLLLTCLASISQSLHKMAQDFRILQSPNFGELAEPFGKHQIGSSAMPFKRNPVKSERICSLSRVVSVLPKVAWDNAATTMLERSLDDSANRRVILPEAFLAVDEALSLAQIVVSGVVVNQKQVERNLDKYAPFASTEKLLLLLTQRGMARNKAHEIIRENSMKAWDAVSKGNDNPLAGLLSNDKRITRLVASGEVEKIVSTKTARAHTGIASNRCGKVLQKIKKSV